MDALRAGIWNDEQVEWWYAQNLLLFVAEHRLHALPAVWRQQSRGANDLLPLVHPRHYQEIVAALEHTQALVWESLNELLVHDLDRCAPGPEPIILVDEARLTRGSLHARSQPFLERDGSYAGIPTDDEQAIGELERLRAGGAGFIAFAWPSFWWLEHFPGFERHLHGHYRRTLANERVILFDLRHGGGSGPIRNTDGGG